MADDTIIIRSQLELDIAESERRIAALEKRLQEAMKGGDMHNIDTLDKWIDSEKAKLEGLKKKLDEVGGATKGVGDETKGVTTELGVMDSVAGGLAKTMAAVFSVSAAKEFVSQLANVRGQFQQFEVAMETLLGNKDKADKLMKQSIELAAKTPFYVSDVVGATKQLLAYGQSADDAVDTVRRLGDIASGVSVSLSRVVGIYGRIMAQGKLTNLTMKQFYSSGIPIINQLQQQLGKTRDEIMKMISAGQISFRMVKQAFEDMTNEGGKFGNMMEKQSHTITGHINVIKGLIQNMFNEIGKDAEGPIEKVLQGVENMVKDYEKWGKTLGAVVVSLGAARAAQMAYVAITKLTTTGLAANSAASISNAVAMMRNATSAKQATVAQKALNRAVMTNPYVLLATAVVAATAGIIAYTRANDFALQSQKRLNKSIAEVAAETTNEASELAKLQAKLKTTTKGTDEHNEAVAEAVSKYGKYIPNLREELERVGDLSTVYDTLTKKIKESVSARAYSSFIEKQDAESAKKLQGYYDSMLEALERRYGKGSEEAYLKLSQIMAGILSPDGISKELQDEIDSFTKVTRVQVNSGVNEVTSNSVQWAIDRIREVRDESDKFHDAAIKAFGIGAEKTDLQKAIEALNDTDLSKLLASIQAVKDEVSETEGGLREFPFNGTLYGYSSRQNDEGKWVPYPVRTANGYSGEGETVRELAEAEKKKRQDKADADAKALKEEQRKQAEAAAAEAAKYIRARDARRKAEKAVAKAELDEMAKANKAEIDLMEDGIAKKLATAEHEKKERLRQIDEQKQAYIDKLKDLARAQWKAANPNSKGEWNEDSFKLTAEQEAFIQKLYGGNGELGQLQIQAQKTATQTIIKSLDEQVKEYGSHYDKQVQIVREWDKKIAEAEAALTEDLAEEERKRLKSTIDGMKRRKAIELAESDYNAATEYGGHNQQRTTLERLWQARIEDAAPGMKDAMERKMRDELAQLDADAFKAQIDWDTVFGDMGEQATASLQRNMDKVKRWLAENRNTLSIDQIRDVEEALAEMSNEIASRNPFVAIRTSVEDLKSTREALPGLVAAYEQALAEFNAAAERQKARKAEIDKELAAPDLTAERRTELTQEQSVVDGELDTAEQNLIDTTRELNAAQNKIATSGMKLIDGINGSRDAIREGASSVAEFAGLFDEDLASAIDEAINLFTELGDIVSEIASKFVKEGEDLVGGLQDTAEGTADAVKGTAEATSAAISAAEAASVVLLVIKAVIIALTAVFRIVKANAEAERRAAEAAHEYAQALREIADAANAAKMVNIFGNDTLGRFRQAAQLIKDINKELKNTVSAAQDEAMFMLPDSWKKQIKSMAGEFGYTFTADMRSGWQKFWGTGSKNIVNKNLQDFIDAEGNIMTDALKAWVDQYGDYLSDSDKQLVDELISQGERFEQAMDDMQSYLEGIFGDTASSIADKMIDAFAQTGDAAADFEDIMSDVAKNIAKSWVVDKLIGSVFNKEAEKRMSDMISANNISGAVAYYNSLIEKANESAPAINEFLQGLDVDWNPDERQAQTKNSLGASQDSVDESNARLTAIQGHTFLMSVDVSAIRSQNSMLVAQSAALLEHVQGIHINTNEMRAMMDDLRTMTGVIRSNVSTIVDRGVKMQ